MDFDSSSKFIASLAKFLQSLCNGYVEFDKGVEVIGHIYLSVDSNTTRKIDYVLNEKVCKNDNSVTFISNSFHAQPAEKPKPPAKPVDPEPASEDLGDEDGLDQGVPSSTNVGTLGASYNRAQNHSNKRQRSNKNSGAPAAKVGRSDFAASPSQRNYSDSYDNSGGFQGGEEDDGYSNYENGSQEIDQKPAIGPDISIVKEEYMANQQNSYPYSENSQSSGPGGGMPESPYPSYPSPSSNYQAAASHSSDPSYVSTPIEAGDPSTLTRAQQEELEMYYRKGTDQHLTFLRNMREAHAMYPFTGKRDKELFDKALAELIKRLPLSQYCIKRTEYCLYKTVNDRRSKTRRGGKGQFKNPGQSPGGGRYARGGHFGGRGGAMMGSPFPASPYGYPATPGGGSEAGDSYLQGPGDASFDYNPPMTPSGDDSQQSINPKQEPASLQGFHGAFGQSSHDPSQQTQPPDMPEIKVEFPPIGVGKDNDYELIEIDEDEDI